MRHYLLILGLVTLFACSDTNTFDQPPGDVEPGTEAFDVVAFGSCNRSNQDQPLWTDILKAQPDLWVWLGDNIYGDSEDMDVLKAKYDRQFSHPGYTRVREYCDVIGIWDDHDYGVNDGGSEYPMRRESRDLLFRFLEVPESNEAWQREGAYQSYTYALNDEANVKFILLDARYFRDPISKKNGAYQPNPDGTILGSAQWTWLEEQLSDGDVDLYVIGSGIQVLPTQHKYEKWANFPKERQRLFDLIVEKQPKGVLFLSGDRHIGEITSVEVEGLDYPLVDITSSGLTHSWNSFPGEPNENRQGKVVTSLNFGVLHLDLSEDEVRVKAEIRGQGGDVLEMIELVY